MFTVDVLYSRPETSFLWILNPMKTFKYIFWKNFKWKILTVLLILLLLLFLALFLYHMPSATVDLIWSLSSST